jgi:nucleoside-diphosphate-sugar epimerase
LSVLVTGGHGFVGSWVTRQIAEQGEEVLVYDAVGSPDRILDPVQGKVRHVSGDVLDYPRLAAAIRDGGVRGVVHAAALVGARVDENPHRGMRINIEGTLNVLEIARQAGGLRIVYVSSGAVYGSAQGPLVETAPMTPSDPYGATKAASEHLCDQYSGRFGVDVSSARIFFVYGPGRVPGPGAGFNTMLFGALAGIEKISFPTGRDQKADWTYVEDAARGIRLMLDADDLPHRAYNIATGVSHSVDDVIETVQRHAPVHARIDIGPGVSLERGAPLDITRAREGLGYAPEHDLDSGVQAYGRWLADG